MKLAILVTTCAPAGEIGASRARCWQPFVEAIRSNLQRPTGWNLTWIVADDASAHEHTARDRWNELAAGEPLHFLPSADGKRHGVGASLNRAIYSANAQGHELQLYAVDDWLMTEPIPYLDAVAVWLHGEPGIGAVRLGPPHPGIRGEVRLAWPYEFWYLKLDRRHGYVFGHRPALYHRRFWEAYGLHPEGMSALETERIYTERYARTNGPETVLYLPAHTFWPLPNAELGDVEP